MNKYERAAHMITGVVKDNQGEITAYEFENGATR